MCYISLDELQAGEISRKNTAYY